MKNKILIAIASMMVIVSAFALTGPFAMNAGASANDVAGEDENAPEAGEDENVPDQAESQEAESVWEADRTALSREISEVFQGTGSRNVVVQTGKKLHISAAVLQELAGKSVTLAMQTGYSLTFTLTGTDIRNTGEDLWISLLPYDAIPYEAKAEVLQRADASREFGMEEKGAYPFTVNVHMNFGAENAGKTAILYYYEEETGTLKAAGSFRATEAGDVMFGLSRGDEYIAMIADRNACMVVSGDTLSGIAVRNGISLRTLLSANPQIQDADRIRPGQSIVIP